MGSLKDIIMHRVRFDDFAIDRHGKVRVVRHHTIQHAFAQVSPTAKKLSVWVRPSPFGWLAFAAGVLLIPFGFIFVGIAYALRAGENKEQLRRDMLNALRPEIPMVGQDTPPPPPPAEVVGGGDTPAEEPKVI